MGEKRARVLLADHTLKMNVRRVGFELNIIIRCLTNKRNILDIGRHGETDFKTSSPKLNQNV